MKIDALHVRIQHLERRDRQWRTSSYASSEVVGVYVGVEAGGALGVGATAAHPRSMPGDVLVEAITQRVQPALAGIPVDGAWAALGGLGRSPATRPDRGGPGSA